MQANASFITLDGTLIDPDVVKFLFTPPGQSQTTYTYPTNIIRTGAGQYYAVVDASTYMGIYALRFQSTGFGQTTTYDVNFTAVASAFGR